MLSYRKDYPSDLTEQQWNLIKGFIPGAKSGGRRRTTDVREVINGIFYLSRTGCAWRYLPKDFPPWQTVYYYFRCWRQEEFWQKILTMVAQKVRIRQGRTSLPSTVIIDSQSVRAPKGEARGWDGFKKVRGRKREILVDTLGILWSAKVHAANQGENRLGVEVMARYPYKLNRPQHVLGDSSYDRAPFDIWLFRNWRIWPERRSGSRGPKFARGRIVKSNLKPQRWIVERSLAWFNNFRRLSRDYEIKTANSEAQIYISQLQLLLRRLDTS